MHEYERMEPQDDTGTREVRSYEPSRELDDPMHVDMMIELAERRALEQTLRRREERRVYSIRESELVRVWGADA